MLYELVIEMARAGRASRWERIWERISMGWESISTLDYERIIQGEHFMVRIGMGGG